MNHPLADIARHFSAGQSIVAISPLGNGLINNTFRVDTQHSAFVLQGINQYVFPQPEQLIANLQTLNLSIEQTTDFSVNLQIPALLLTDKQHNHVLDADGQFWRALQLIQPAECREQISNNQELHAVGHALGHFHRMCSAVSTADLHDTLPGFHITPEYYRHYQLVLQRNPAIAADSRFDYCKDFIQRFTPQINVLEHAKQQGILQERVIHGDPKFNNFLFTPNTNHIVSLIDLDTVKPGLVHYDIGDCLRSCCHIPDDNRFNVDYCQILLTAYLQEARYFFTRHDYDYLYPAILLIPFELGLRFFSDYLAGNPYFKVDDAEHNLRRAVAQFQLCESISAQQAVINNLINQLKP